MLIHLEGKVVNNTIHFDLPQVYFKQGQSVSVASVEIQWNAENRIDLYGEITSTLVDKSPCNPKQQIYRFHKLKRSNYTIDTPTQFLDYKIQCLDLKASVFKIHVYSLEEKIVNSVKGVYLILFISDARLQSVPTGKSY